MKIVDKCTKYIRRILQAEHCYLCGAPNTHSKYDFCQDCATELPYKNQSCSRCALPLESTESLVCGHCVTQQPHYDVLLSPFEYHYPIDKFITELKFRHKLYHARTLGDLFSQYIIDKATPLPECIIPVPLHPARLRQRGYNQSLEIARTLSKNLQIPIASKFCKRIKNTKPQSDLDAKSRQHNILNAFKVKQGQHYNHVAILDDVVTTGHTVEALAKLLRQENIKIIQVWSIARVNQIK